MNFLRIQSCCRLNNSPSAQEQFQGLKPLCGHGSAMLHAIYAHSKANLPIVWCTNCRVYVTHDLFTVWFRSYFFPAVKNVSWGHWHWKSCSAATQKAHLATHSSRKLGTHYLPKWNSTSLTKHHISHVAHSITWCSVNWPKGQHHSLWTNIHTIHSYSETPFLLK